MNTYFMYDNDGKYIGHVLEESDCFEGYSYTTVEPPAHDVDPDNIFKPVNWPYWINSSWQLMPRGE